MPADWRLTYPGTDLAFGSVDSRLVFPQSAPPDVSATSTTDQDTSIPRGDGVLVGQDFRGGLTVTFSVEVDGGDSDTAALALEQNLAKAWRGDSIRSIPNAVATLTSHTGRSLFGRPRKYQPNYDLLPFGVTAVTCEFQSVDDLWYGPEQIATVKLVPDVGGGLVAPLASPVSTTATSDRSQTFTVGGTQPVWPVITITGPITNPSIEVPGLFQMAFNLTIAADQTLVIDTRPWARTILLNGAGVPGKRDPRTARLSEAAITPGRHDFALRGASSTGTPEARISWRDAFPSM